MTQLKECPFCGCKYTEVLDFDHPEMGTMYYVTCCVCHSSGPENTSRDQAIREWNGPTRKNDKLNFVGITRNEGKQYRNYYY